MTASERQARFDDLLDHPGKGDLHALQEVMLKDHDGIEYLCSVVYHCDDYEDGPSAYDVIWYDDDWNPTDRLPTNPELRKVTKILRDNEYVEDRMREYYYREDDDPWWSANEDRIMESRFGF